MEKQGLIGFLAGITISAILTSAAWYLSRPDSNTEIIKQYEQIAKDYGQEIKELGGINQKQQKIINQQIQEIAKLKIENSGKDKIIKIYEDVAAKRIEEISGLQKQFEIVRKNNFILKENAFYLENELSIYKKQIKSRNMPIYLGLIKSVRKKPNYKLVLFDIDIKDTGNLENNIKQLQIRPKDFYKKTNTYSLQELAETLAEGSFWGLLTDINNDKMPDIICDNRFMRLNKKTETAVRYKQKDGTFAPARPLTNKVWEKIMRNLYLPKRARARTRN